jgi:hypothetical protein
MALKIVASGSSVSRAVFGSEGGCLILLMFLLISFMIGHKCGIPWAEHAAIATLSVLLVQLNNPTVATGEVRIAGLVTVLFIGMIAVTMHIQCGEQTVLSTLAVLLVAITEHMRPPHVQ